MDTTRKTTNNMISDVSMPQSKPHFQTYSLINVIKLFHICFLSSPPPPQIHHTTTSAACPIPTWTKWTAIRTTNRKRWASTSSTSNSNSIRNSSTCHSATTRRWRAATRRPTRAIGASFVRSSCKVRSQIATKSEHFTVENQNGTQQIEPRIL